MTMPLSVVREARAKIHVEVPTCQAHKSPQLLAVGETFSLGTTNLPGIVLEALAEHKLRLSFAIESTNEVFSSVEFFFHKLLLGHGLHQVACHGKLVESSCLQLKEPLESLAILSFDNNTGEAWLTCERIVYARVTSVTLTTDRWGEYPPSWSTRIEYDGISMNFSGVARNYDVGDLVRVRISPGVVRPRLFIM